MTRLERYREKLRQFEEKRGKLMRSGKYVQSMALNADIRELEMKIRQAEEYEEACKPRPIRELLTRKEIDEMGIIPLMIECHLAADFLTAVAYMVVDTCKAHGLRDVSFMPELKEIIKRTEKFASFLTTLSSERLTDLIVDDDTLCNALHKKCMSYITQRLGKRK